MNLSHRDKFVTRGTPVKGRTEKNIVKNILVRLIFIVKTLFSLNENFEDDIFKSFFLKSFLKHS